MRYLFLFSCSVLFIVYVYKAKNHTAIFEGILLASQILVALIVMPRVVLPRTVYSPQREKICIWGIRLGHTQTILLSYRESSLVASFDMISTYKRMIQTVQMCKYNFE